MVAEIFCQKLFSVLSFRHKVFTHYICFHFWTKFNIWLKIYGTHVPKLFELEVVFFFLKYTVIYVFLFYTCRMLFIISFFFSFERKINVIGTGVKDIFKKYKILSYFLKCHEICNYFFCVHRNKCLISVCYALLLICIQTTNWQEHMKIGYITRQNT